MKTNYKEGVILSNNRPLARGLQVWQSLVQLSISRKFFSKYDLICDGYVRKEQCQSLIKEEGWAIGAVLAKGIQFNGIELALSGKYGNRAAVLVNFKSKALRIVTTEPNTNQKSSISKCGSKMSRIPLIVESAEAFKAQIWA